MRIIHLNFGLETGGTETMLVDILNEQCQFVDLHLVIINATYNPALLARIDQRVQVHLIDRPAGSRNPGYLVKLNRLLWRLKPDVIHCHNPKAVTLLRQSCRKYLTVHDVTVPTTYFRQYNRLFAISSIVQTDIKQRSGLDAAVIYNGVPAATIRQKYPPYSNGPFRMVQISRLMHQKKGQHILLHALNQLITEFGLDTIHLDFIGEGDSWAILKNMVTELKLEPYVSFLGLKDRAYIYQQLAEYDLLVQPSLYEGFGLTVVEAMAAGVPVLVSDIDGPLEIINTGTFGTSFTTGNADDCADHIRTIISESTTDHFQQKIYQAKVHARSAFTVQRTAQEYLDAYALPDNVPFISFLSAKTV
ncbi:glycosyltransferase [Spirosoma agri]|uniref:Glycosyltransferase n=1 Tax=Spirosoma agri TaxID=1987381 RepID=A0A6M0IN21_9BACT|nr:glycosyltransferase [Spirosoma agri]NEU69327.1 glycosyltransferase [Spirosoma agri]